MRAARYYGKEDIRVETNVVEPAVKAGQVKIKPSHVGICGTDLHEFLGGPNFCPVHAHPITQEAIPVTLGHEFSGVVVELGEGVTGLKVGQPCAVQPTLACGSCPACEVKAPNVCHKGGFVGLSGNGGGLSEAVCVDANRVFVLPDGLGLDEGALVEPLAVAWHAASAAPKMDKNTVVYIAGGGPIGLALILCLKSQGVEKIITAEVAEKRQKFAKEFGATAVLNPATDNVLVELMKMTNNKGVDVAFDCAGVPASIKSVCESVKTKGAIVNVAIWEKEIPFNPNWLTFKESSYTSVLGYNAEDFQAVVDRLRDGTIKPTKMITAKIKLENLVQDGIKTLINDKDSHVKILVDMSA